jgi:(2Fe-2S) ferredoxin
LDLDVGRNKTARRQQGWAFPAIGAPETPVLRLTRGQAYSGLRRDVYNDECSAWEQQKIRNFIFFVSFVSPRGAYFWLRGEFFYNLQLRNKTMPRPEKHVFVCTQNRPQGHPRGSCASSGCAEIMNEFMNEIQARNLFEKIALTNTGCLGPCMMGPSVLVYPDGVMYGKLKKDDVKTIIEQHLLGGEPVAELQVPAEIW